MSETNPNLNRFTCHVTHPPFVKACDKAFRRAVDHRVGEHMALQNAVVRDLGPGQQMVYPKSADDWGKALSSPHHHILAIRDTSANETGCVPPLVAHAVVTLPGHGAKKSDLGLPFTRLAVETDRMAVIGTIMVHPAYQQKGLMGRLLQAWHLVAGSHSRPCLVASVTTTNQLSLAGFLKARLAVCDVAPDPEDGSIVFLMRRMLKAEDAIEPVNAGEQIEIPLDAGVGEHAKCISGGCAGIALSMQPGHTMPRMVYQR